MRGALTGADYILLSTYMACKITDEGMMGAWRGVKGPALVLPQNILFIDPSASHT